MKNYILLLLGVLIGALSLNGQVLETSEVHVANELMPSILDTKLRAYSAFIMDMAIIPDLQNAENNQIPYIEVNLTSGPFNTMVFLENSGIVAENYVRRTSSGVSERGLTIASAMKGYTAEGHVARFTINQNYFHGYIEVAGGRYYVESAQKFDESLNRDIFLIYHVDDIVEVPYAECGTIGEMPEMSSEEIEAKQLAGECLEVEYAIAADYMMYELYESVQAVENQIISVSNDMETNYEGDFSDEIRYRIVETYIVDCESCDPWSQTTKPSDLLGSFSSWARGPNGFQKFNDLGALWTARKLDGNTVGIAWINGLCTHNKYHVLSDFTDYAEALRVMASHEIGHNWGCQHDDEGSPYIMAPVLNITNDWSVGSINTINITISNKRGGTCLEPCGEEEEMPVAKFTVDNNELCEGDAVIFENLSENADSYEWIFEGGEPATSTDPSPYVYYSESGEYPVTLIAYSSQGSDTTVKEQYIRVKAIPQALFSTSDENRIIEFLNQSIGGESYLWDFGDGNGSSGENPVHEYAEDGDYLVLLTAFNNCGEHQYEKMISVEDKTVYPPINDMPCEAIEIMADGSCEDGTTVGADFDWAGYCDYSYYESTVYYKTTIPPRHKELTTSVLGITEGSILVLEFTDGCDEMPSLVDAHCGEFPAELTTPVEAGKTYYIMVSTSTQDAADFTICLTSSAPPPGCADNDTCATAEALSSGPIEVNQGEICVDGCNIGVGERYRFTGCIDESWSVVFYTFTTSKFTNNATITVSSEDTNVDEIAVLLMPNCTAHSLCRIGEGGYVSTSSIQVDSETTYYIAVATPMDGEGEFTVCVSTDMFTDEYCIGRDHEADTSYARLTVTGTSFGSPKSGPYIPGEEVTFEYYIPNYSATTSIQWLQGIVPVFGSGWDPSSFDTTGMPMISSGPNSHGATWQWWKEREVTYNGETLAYSTYIDELGRLALCHYSESRCDFSGLAPGQELPAGWYAMRPSPYCTYTEHPNTGIGDGMTGPWTVSFTLKARSSAGPEGCGETTYIDCSVQMFTFSDEQIGCWYGASDPNACIGDGSKFVPALSKCCDVPDLSFEVNYDGLTAEFMNTSEENLNYFWDFGDGNTSTEENPMHTYENYGRYTVTLSAENDCGPYIYENEVLLVGPTEAAFDVSQNTGCQGMVVTYANQSSGNELKYLWIFEGGSPNTSTRKNPEVRYDTPGVYGTTLIAYNQHEADTLIYEDYITVHPLPVADFDFEVYGTTVNFIQKSVYAESWSWDFGNGEYSTEMEPQVTYEQAGEYEVLLVVENSCGIDSITHLIPVITATKENVKLDFNIYPNPFNDYITIELPDRIQSAVDVSVMDMNGRVWVLEKISANGKRKHQIDLSGRLPGIYVMAVKAEDMVIYQKLIKL